MANKRKADWERNVVGEREGDNESRSGQTGEVGRIGPWAAALRLPVRHR